jgi:hypothetical protein
MSDSNNSKLHPLKNPDDKKNPQQSQTFYTPTYKTPSHSVWEYNECHAHSLPLEDEKEAQAEKNDKDNCFNSCYW